MSARVTVYVRPGCHLCDEALTQAEPVFAALGIQAEVVDIEGDDRLHARYLERIPVFCVDGVELFDYFFDEGALRTAIGA